MKEKTQNKYAFVLLHFGSKIKYFELELYFAQMLCKYSSKNTDKIYMYTNGENVNRTPEFFVKTMEKYFDYCIGCPDIPEDPAFKSGYSHFNTLTTCNFINAYKLIQYDKICILESDMVITENISDIFKLPIPSVLFINEGPIPEYLPSEESIINGGILLFKPSWYAWYSSLKLLPGIVADNCKYPNEELFLRTWSRKKIYPLPERYNYCHYHLSKLSPNAKLPSIVHFNETRYKYLDIIKDGYKNKFSEKVRVVNFFKNNFYYKHKKEISIIIANAKLIGLS